EPGRRIDVHDEMSQVTSAIALKTLFDLDAPDDRGSFTTALRQVFDELSTRFRKIVHLPDWVPTPHNRRVRRAVAELEVLVNKFIAAGRARKTPGNDLLSALLHAQDDDGSRMTDRQLRDEAMTLYLAGHETTALTLSWAWYLLAQHPRVEEKLVDE